MPKFEKYGETIIYCDSSVGAILDSNTGKWCPFRFFDSGNIDFGDKNFDTHFSAYEYALRTYT